METEQENTENSFKDNNEVENIGVEEMPTKKKKLKYVRGHYRKIGNKKVYVKPHYRNVSNPEKKKAKKKRTIKSPKGSGTVTRSAVAKAAKKVTSKRLATKKNR